MTRSRKTEEYLERRQARIDISNHKKEMQEDERRERIRKEVEEDNYLRLRQGWDCWRNEIIYGTRYTPYLRYFDDLTISQMFLHIKEQQARGDGWPSGEEASFRTILDLLEARIACERDTYDSCPILLHIKRLYNLYALKRYARTLDM